MIINLKKAILHILDANSGVTVYSKGEIDLEDKNILSYICTHIDKVYDNPSMRTGTFKENSGFLYKLTQYKNEEIKFCEFSEFVAQRLHEQISESDNIE